MGGNFPEQALETEKCKGGLGSFLLACIVTHLTPTPPYTFLIYHWYPTTMLYGAKTQKSYEFYLHCCENLKSHISAELVVKIVL
jgi:hypothetical protein